MRLRTLVLAIIDRPARRRRARPGPRRAPSQAPQAARGRRPAPGPQRLPRQPRAVRAPSGCRRRNTSRRRGGVPGHAPGRARAEEPNTLVVGAGDIIGASPLVSGLFHDEPTIERSTRWASTSARVGNHEFDEGADELLRMQSGGCHPVDGCQAPTASPARTSPTSRRTSSTERAGALPARPRSEVGGVKVGFIGVVLKDTPSVVTPGGVAGLTFGDEADAINVRGQAAQKGVRRDRRAHPPGRHAASAQATTASPGGPAGRHHRGARARRSTSSSPATRHQAYNCVDRAASSSPGRRRSAAC